MAEYNKSEEIDLGHLFNRAKESYRKSLVFLYRKFRSNRIPLLVIIIIGIIAGFLLNSLKKDLKETTLIVQINFDSTNYVYNAIEQLNNKVKEKDTLFLANQGLYSKKSIIVSSEIQPIVNIMDILNNTETTNSAYLKTVFEESKFEDDILTSEVFIPQYKFHKITLVSNYENTQAVIEGFMKFLNNNDLLNKIKEIRVDNTKMIIERNENSISYIDSIVKVYGTMIENPVSTGQVYYNSYEINNSNIHLLFTSKDELLEKNLELQTELQKYDHIVEVINKPEFQLKREFNYIFVIPILFILIYIIFGLLAGVYRKAKNLSNSPSYN